MSHPSPRGFPIRVGVVSRSHVVRSGLVHLIAQLRERALVTEAVSLDGDLVDHDVVIYDLGAIEDDLLAHRDLRGLLASGTQLIGLVYDDSRRTPAAFGEDGAQVISLAVTPDDLMDALDEAVARRGRAGTSRRRLPRELSEQEFRVVELIGAGMSNDDIAAELVVSINTVKTYIRTAYRKLDVNDRPAAMLWALEHGLAGGPGPR